MIGKPPLQQTTAEYRSASGHAIPILGTVRADSSLQTGEETLAPKELEFTVTKLNLNLIGLDTVLESGINIDSLLHKFSNNAPVCTMSGSDHKSLQEACQQLTREFPNLWRDELGCLQDFQLEVNFKPDTKPVFCKQRTMPFAMQDDLSQAYNKGIEKGLWKPVQFNDYGTPVVPVRKTPLAIHPKGSTRVCGDYSVTVNP